MKPQPEFKIKPASFWALARYASEQIGYSARIRGQSGLRRYKPEELSKCLSEYRIPPALLKQVLKYLNFRAEALEGVVAPLLMDRAEAKVLFERLKTQLKPKCALPMNKQSGEKRHYNYLTCIVNMLTEKALGPDVVFDDGPRNLCVITDDRGVPTKVLSRWMDGAYPSVMDPHAVWEVKEYYGTTTFGSRVADGVYETQLDGYEIKETQTLLGKRIHHYLFVDDRFTWWSCGKSYLCRLIDMMHMGLVDEVIFGKEVIVRWPEIVRGWRRFTK